MGSWCLCLRVNELTILLVGILICGAFEMSKRPVRGVLWDLDGTLLDTETLSTEAMQKVITEIAPSVDGRSWQLKRQILGMRAPEWCELLLNELNLQDKIEPKDFAKRWEQNLNSLCPQIVKCEGAEELTAHFANLNIRQVIATSSSSEAVDQKKKNHTDLFKRMECVVTGDQVSRGKPDPMIFQMAAETLGLEAFSCLAFEDSLAGVQSAHAAGATVIAVIDKRFTDAERHQFDKYCYSVNTSLLDCRKILEDFTFLK